MKKISLTKRTVRFIAKKCIGKKRAQQIIVLLYKLTDVNLLTIALNQQGILKYKSFELSGEAFLFKKILRKVIEDKDVLIDIGANKGEYSQQLQTIFPKNRIISVEPNPETFKLLLAVNKDSYNIAVSSKTGSLEFFTSASNPTSTQASISKESIPQMEKAVAIKVQSVTLSNLIAKIGAEKIGLLKVDVEGHEFEVLQSGKPELAKVKIIQFEFNEKHTYTRTFLKDFYSLLSHSHDIFRLDSNKLIDLNEYSALNEIFRYQNFAAIRKGLITSFDEFL